LELEAAVTQSREIVIFEISSIASTLIREIRLVGTAANRPLALVARSNQLNACVVASVRACKRHAPD